MTDETLKSFYRRIKSILCDQDELSEDLKELKKEVKEAGFDPAILTQLAKDEVKDRVAKRARGREVADEYRRRLGLTPLEAFLDQIDEVDKGEAEVSVGTEDEAPAQVH